MLWVAFNAVITERDIKTCHVMRRDCPILRPHHLKAENMTCLSQLANFALNYSNYFEKKDVNQLMKWKEFTLNVSINTMRCRSLCVCARCRVERKEVGRHLSRIVYPRKSGEMHGCRVSPCICLFIDVLMELHRFRINVEPVDAVGTISPTGGGAYILYIPYIPYIF